MFCSYERVSTLLNPDYSDKITIEEYKESSVIPFAKHQFIKES